MRIAIDADTAVTVEVLEAADNPDGDGPKVLLAVDSDAEAIESGLASAELACAWLTPTQAELVVDAIHKAIAAAH